MSLRVPRPLPFCNQPAGADYSIPEQYYPNGSSVTRGFPWDGIIDALSFGVFGPGTAHPIGLTFEQMGRWYWKLDKWKTALNFDVTNANSSPPDPTYSETIIYADAQSDFPMLEVPMRNRINGRILQVIKGKYAGDGNPYSSDLLFNFGDVLIDYHVPVPPGDPPAPPKYYPKITFTLVSSAAVGVGDPYQGTTSYVRHYPDASLPSIALGVNLSIIDGTGGTFSIQLYKDDASTSGVIPSAIVTSASFKATGFRTTD